MRRGIALAVAALVVVAVAAPATEAKSRKISGTIFITVPGFDSNHLSTATGFISAKKGCGGNRAVRLAYFNSDGSPVAVGNPVTVSLSTGSIIAVLSEPPRPAIADPSQPYTFIIRVAVDPLTIKKKGKKISCLPITGPESLVQVPGRPPSSF